VIAAPRWTGAGAFARVGLVIRLFLTLLLASPLLAVTAAGAQVPIPRVPVQPPTTRGGAEPAPLNRDKLLVEWAEPDSIMKELLARSGYSTVQYQGDKVTFDAITKLLTMRGKPSAVRRGETILVGDTIVYDDSTKLVVATGDTVVLRDPSRDDADDFVARGSIRYDLETQEGTTGSFSTSVVSGQRLFITAESGTILGDTTLTGGRRLFFHDADFTYCDLSEPHFHFTAKDIKFVSENVVVARPGVLYIGEVPVFWLPFFFQDVRSGRRSGLLTPRFGVAELFRNSANYQRTVENVGWFFAINDYADAEVSMDWRSGGSGSGFDAGWLRGNTEFRYKWLSRFIDGNAAVSYLGQNGGQTNTSISWRHNQSFSKSTRVSANINWVQSTTVQRQTTFNPTASLATIVSQLNYQTKVGPLNLSVGGTRKQYPGRLQTDTDLPNFNLTTGTLAFGRFEWTPSLRFNQARTNNIDQGIQFGNIYRPNQLGGLDSTRVSASRSNTNFGFETPFKIFDFQVNNSVSITERFDDYPEQKIVRDVNDSSKVFTRIFAQRFFTNVDWNTSFNLPRFLQGSWNVSPSVQFVNTDPSAGFIVRSELSRGKYVQQGKRAQYGVSAAPVLYGLFPGLGPVEAIRHSVSPQISYSVSPRADVSDAFLEATGRTRQGYLGSLPRNAISLAFATTFEAKMRAPSPEDVAEGAASDSLGVDPDSAPALGAGDDPNAPRIPRGPAAEGRKVRLLALNFSSLTYDFIRADTASSGLVEQNFTISARTDLLPNLDFQMGYELFQGDPLSDTARFKPFRNTLGVNFSLDGQSGLVALIGRLFGRRGEIESPEAADSATASRRSEFSQFGGGGLRAAGSGARGAPVSLPSSGAGWQLSLTYNANRQRPPIGGTQIEYDPALACRGIPEGSFAYQDCLANATNSPPVGFQPEGQVTAGGPLYIQPPSENLSGNLSFGLTQNWSGSMSAQYDMVRRDFGSLQLGLQREMHDWNAVFSFTRVPNGNFAFNFFIALKASPEIKFNYDRRSVR
jgi:lipopolysaccharide assembly outer membrane protein LptD (OstA)